MPDCAEDAKRHQQELSQAVDACNFEEFNRKYIAFLSQFEAFTKAHSDTPTPVVVENIIFGKTAFYLHPTSDEQAKAQIAKARAASEVLAQLTVEERLQFLNLLEHAIVKYQDAIMTIITADTGKPIDLSRGEITKGTEWFEYTRAQADIQLGKKQVGKLLNDTRPMGCVQVISAYNYPLALSIGGLVGGIAAGNGVILTAPMKAPNWLFPFTEAVAVARDAFIEQAKADGKAWAGQLEKCADGLIQHSIGINHYLTTHADIVHFVGSDIVGNQIRTMRDGKPTILEISGNNVVTVMKSALASMSAEEIAKNIYGGFGPATGQRCTAPRLLCLEKGAEVVGEALHALCANGADTKDIGNPFKPGIKIGPLVDKIAYLKIQDAISLANHIGGTVYGIFQADVQNVPLAVVNACWINPIVIDWSTANLADEETREKLEACLQQETFGPLLHILPPIETLEEVTRTIAALDYHRLAATLYSSEPQEVNAFLDKVNATSITVNGPTKDLSPWGYHGHPGLQAIGGATHFHLYANHVSRMITGI